MHAATMGPNIMVGEDTCVYPTMLSCIETIEGTRNETGGEYTLDAAKTYCENPNITISTWTTEKFQIEVAGIAQMHASLTRILTFFLGFYVGTMMKRWWDQVSHLPNITSLAMFLNGMVPRSHDSLALKKTILRYCLLSYHAVIVQITRDNKKHKMEGAMGKDLIKSNEVQKFNLSNPHNWWLPINKACALVQERKQEFSDKKDVVSAIGKFEHR